MDVEDTPRRKPIRGPKWVTRYRGGTGNDALARYEKLVATNPEVERKDKHRAASLEKHRTKLSEQHGRVMKEYVLVRASLPRNTRAMKETQRQDK